MPECVTAHRAGRPLRCCEPTYEGGVCSVLVLSIVGNHLVASTDWLADETDWLCCCAACCAVACCAMQGCRRARGRLHDPAAAVPCARRAVHAATQDAAGWRRTAGGALFCPGGAAPAAIHQQLYSRRGSDAVVRVNAGRQLIHAGCRRSLFIIVLCDPLFIIGTRAQGAHVVDSSSHEKTLVDVLRRARGLRLRQPASCCIPASCLSVGVLDGYSL